MSRQKINGISAIGPMAMSLAALVFVIVAVTTGWGMATKDEGVAAHIFQLLIALQLPLIITFVVTADCSRWVRVATVLGMQAVALALAFAPVAYFRL
jgi:hypothetical protein